MIGKREHSAEQVKIERLDDMIGLMDALNNALNASKRKRKRQERMLKVADAAGGSKQKEASK